MKTYLSWLSGILISTLILFGWSGLSQRLPWGVPSVKTYSALPQAAESRTFDAPHLIRLAPNALTTKDFDSLLVNEVNTLETGQSFSWIITRPADYYDPVAYLTRALLTHLVVGILLTVLSYCTTALSLRRRMLLTLLMATASSVATYGELWNWWGLTTVYALGVSVNLVIGWSLSSLILSRFVFRSNG